MVNVAQNSSNTQCYINNARDDPIQWSPFISELISTEQKRYIAQKQPKESVCLNSNSKNKATQHSLPMPKQRYMRPSGSHEKTKNSCESIVPNEKNTIYRNNTKA